MVGFFRLEGKCMKRILCLGAIKGGKMTIKACNNKEIKKYVEER